jgi:hypothetical protein
MSNLLPQRVLHERGRLRIPTYFSFAAHGERQKEKTASMDSKGDAIVGLGEEEEGKLIFELSFSPD